MRLGWLSRLGIVLTAFGLPITATIQASKWIGEVSDGHRAARDLCLKLAHDKPPSEINSCYDQWDRAPIDTGYLWKTAFGVAAVMFALAWLIAIAIYWSIVWILAGRQRADQNETV